jgi:hypothetical protein
MFHLYPDRALRPHVRLLAPLLAAAALLAVPSLAVARPIDGIQIDAVSTSHTSAQTSAQLAAVRAAGGKIIRV